jgi:hypothetical protein
MMHHVFPGEWTEKDPRHAIAAAGAAAALLTLADVLAQSDVETFTRAEILDRLAEEAQIYEDLSAFVVLLYRAEQSASEGLSPEEP